LNKQPGTAYKLVSSGLELGEELTSSDYVKVFC